MKKFCRAISHLIFVIRDDPTGTILFWAGSSIRAFENRACFLLHSPFLIGLGAETDGMLAWLARINGIYGYGHLEE